MGPVAWNADESFNFSHWDASPAGKLYLPETEARQQKLQRVADYLCKHHVPVWVWVPTEKRVAAPGSRRGKIIEKLVGYKGEVVNPGGETNNTPGYVRVKFGHTKSDIYGLGELWADRENAEVTQKFC